ncbi:uncharacterized protein BDR25DRAFT_19457 [Lindgomyces ingoldianus]|uniref:Uncharacterized protein n=1 Tax=Lindgomyces ingoldianus TaxID=673940 RepID=A0ACB6R1L0_9PLEO|nr:uncharacterized protein BDR25DRAFT_19457 [Lindgomyces ingoldianus]KAF2472222.1 hypothetical protein BDR25DRAFT_19457 [Lindgomyces ingoldianus]
MCDGAVYANLMNQLLCHDADEFEWERGRVQLGLTLQFHVFSGGRPGGFISTGYYPDLCLVYRDVQFILIRLQDGQEKFGIVLVQRWRKGEEEKLDENLHVLWLEEDDILNCPVQQFLALAFADGAFASITSRSDIQNAKLDSDEDVRTFQYKPEMPDQPFLVDPKGKPLHYAQFWYNLKWLSIRAGYIEHIRPYDIRRGTANKLDEAVEVSTNSRNRLLGHSSDKVYQKYYQSNISMVDIKGIVLRDKADEGFDTTALRRNLRLKRVPSRLPSRANQKFLTQFRMSMITEPEITKDVLHKRARAAAWKDFQASWTERYETIEPPEHQHLSRIKDSVEHLGNLDDPETKSRIMMRFDEHRRLIKEEVGKPGYSLRTSPALDSLVFLARRNYTHSALYYPGTEPEESTSGALRCRFCRIDLVG